MVGETGLEPPHRCAFATTSVSRFSIAIAILRSPTALDKDLHPGGCLRNVGTEGTTRSTGRSAANLLGRGQLGRACTGSGSCADREDALLDLVVLILDLAHDLLKHVLEREDSYHWAPHVLAHDREMRVLATKAP